MLQEKFSWNKAVFPHLYDIAVVDCVTQLRQSHVQFVHSTSKWEFGLTLKAQIHVSHAKRKPVFGILWPGMTQIDLLSYTNQLEPHVFVCSKYRHYII